MRKIPAFLGKTLLVAALVVLCAEGIIRLKIRYLQARFVSGSAQLRESDFNILWLPIVSKVNHRLWNYFLLGRPDPRLRTLPQMITYGEQDDPTLSHVGRFRLKPGSYLLVDFTRDPTSKGATFRAHINTAGFRGPERPLAKDVRSIRVLCWGAYQTFGHGVADDATYPAQLEALLNATRGKRFEVWNAGVQSMSLRDLKSRITPDFSDLKPDIVILEAGFVDVASLKADYLLNPGTFLFSRGSDFWKLSYRLFARIYTGPLGKSYLVALLFQKLASEKSAEALAAWRAEMWETIAFLRKNGSKVILMSPTAGGFPAEEYAALAADPGVFFFDSRKVFADYLGSHPELSHAREKKAMWLEEFDEATRKKLADSPGSVLKQNFSHPDPLGYHVLAEALAPLILREALSATPARSGRR